HCSALSTTTRRLTMKDENRTFHGTKYQSRNSEVEADRVTVRFGPEVTKNLFRLEAAVRGKEGFDTDTLTLLQRLCSEKPIPIENAVTDLLMVTKEVSRYAAMTNDDEARSALTEVIGHVMGQSIDAKPLTLFVGPKANAVRRSR